MCAVRSPVSGRISTGLSGLDAQLGGGVAPGSCIVVVGKPMNAFELLGYHILSGAKEAGTYYGCDRPLEDVEADMRRIGVDLNRVDLAPLGDHPPAIPAGNRIVIDHWSALADLSPDAARTYLDGLRGAVRDAGEIAVLLVVEGLLPDDDLLRLQNWADGVMDMGVDRQGFGLYPFIRITKMRGVPDSARFLLFKETDKGLFMESTRRVF